MNGVRAPVVLLLAAFASALSASYAQQNPPHIAYVFPAGGRQGTTFQAVLGGQFLQNAVGAYVSGADVRAVRSDDVARLNVKEVARLRERLQELQKQPVNPAVQKEIAEIRGKLFVFGRQRITSPALAERMTIEVTIAEDAEPGVRELRLQTPAGLSNPLAFCVSRLPEFTERQELQVTVPPGSSQPLIIRPPTDMAIKLPAVVNGRIEAGVTQEQAGERQGTQFTPGDVDRYRFQAHRGQHIVICVSARELIPFLADAVPGWFAATVGLYDSRGKELAYAGEFRIQPDPVLYCEIPSDGEYFVEVKDSLYRGRDDFVYRLTLGELSFLTGVFPLGGRAGSKVAVKLTGWNLTAENVTFDAKGKTTGIQAFSAPGKEPSLNSLHIAIDALPEAPEKESNDTPGSAQKVTLPVIINGRIDKPGDWDVFSFKGRAGDKIVAEVRAHRLSSPLDSALRLTDSSGRQLAANDDFEDKGAGLETHHADSYLSAVLPATGAYYLTLGDAQQRGGAEHAYRLRISWPQPDFDLRVVPSSLNGVAGAVIPITVYALRKDGFPGEIRLSLLSPGEGFLLSGGLIPPGVDQLRLTLTLPTTPAKDPLKLTLVGRAVIDGHEVTRQAVPAEEMMQAFAYRHIVPAQDFMAWIRRGGSLMAAARIVSEQPIKIPVGAMARLRIELPPLPPGFPIEKMEFELSPPPVGIELRETPSLARERELELVCDSSKAAPGLRGNLIINIVGHRKPQRVGATSPLAGERMPLGTLPAIPFEITGRPQN